jgi:hypothetical protein
VPSLACVRLALATCAVLVGGLVSTGGFASGARAALPVCTADQVRALFMQHIAAFNRGDRTTLDQLWERDRFGWYSTMAPGQRFAEEAKRRSTLLRYFAARHAHRERLRVRTFHFNGSSNAYGDFEYQLWRSSDELPAAVAVLGKGAVTCGETRRLAVWSMGRE